MPGLSSQVSMLSIANTCCSDTHLVPSYHLRLNFFNKKARKLQPKWQKATQKRKQQLIRLICILLFGVIAEERQETRRRRSTSNLLMQPMMWWARVFTTFAPIRWEFHSWQTRKQLQNIFNTSPVNGPLNQTDIDKNCGATRCTSRTIERGRQQRADEYIAHFTMSCVMHEMLYVDSDVCYTCDKWRKNCLS